MKEYFSQLRFLLINVFSSISSDSVSLLCGYPNYSMNPDIVEGFIPFLETDFRDRILEGQSQFKTKPIKDTINMITECTEFIDLDAKASEWVLKQYKGNPDKLLKECIQNISHGRLSEMIEKGEIFLPKWFENPEYQALINKPKEIVLRLLESIEKLQISLIQADTRYEEGDGILLPYEWRVRQEIKYIRWIIKQGIQSAFPEIIANSQQEKNPFGWMVEKSSQRVYSIVDKSFSKSGEEAQKLLQKALSCKPSTAQACNIYYLLGMGYEDLGENEKAIEAYSNMLSVAPPNGIGLFYRGRILFQLGRYKEARRDFETALNLGQDHIYLLNENDKREITVLLAVINERAKER
jgi:tetratricopeptide (TPR) repeat protein